MSLRYAVSVGVVAAALVFAQDATAQTSMRFNQGPGIKLGDSLVLHPGLEIEGRYDSNVFYTDGSKGAPYLRLIGHVELATLSPQRLTDGDGNIAEQKLKFRFRTAFAYREYFGDDNVRGQRAFEVQAAIGLNVLPGRVFSFSIGDEYARTVTARNFEGPDTYARDVNRLNAGITLAPGGGRLTFSLGYELLLDAYEQAPANQLNKFHNGILFEGKWRILPKTAIFIDVNQQFVSYYNTVSATQKSSSKPMRLGVGIIGLFTPQLSATAKVGYGNSFHTTGDSFSSILARVDLSYQFMPTALLKVGYEHLFEDSMFGNFFTDEYAFLRYDHTIFRRVVLHLGFDYRYRRYGALPDGLTSYTQHVLTASLGVDVMIRDWIYVGVGYDLNGALVPSGQSVGSSNFALNPWTKHQVLGKVGVSY